MKESLPFIFDIHRFALDDGPGIRTTVFLKGCPLACRWCHNPESMRASPEIAFYGDKCIHCGTCTVVCPEAAISDSHLPQIDRRRCSACGKCSDACPAGAIAVMGKAYPPGDLVEIILRDRRFFDASGGGVTFSGGEPTQHMDYLHAILTALEPENLHIAIQTCGLFDGDEFSRKILPFVDLIMFDIKFINAEEHRKFTGHDNLSILGNFRRLMKEAGGKVRPRVPLVPGITATADNVLEIASFLSELGVSRCDLLPYNPAGIEKRRILGMKRRPHLPDLPLSTDAEEALRKLFLARLAERIDIAA